MSHPFVFSDKFDRKTLERFCQAYGPCASTHTLNIQKCVRHVLELEGEKTRGCIGNVYSTLAKLFADGDTEILLGPNERQIVYQLVSDLCSRIELHSTDKIVEFLEKRLERSISRGIGNVSHKKNPLGVKDTLLDKVPESGNF